MKDRLKERKEEKIEGLRKCRIFRDLTDREIETIVKYTEQETYPPNSRFFEEKSLAHRFFIVVDGKVSIKMGKDSFGEAMEVDTVGPGEIFGWSAVVEPKSFTAAARALEETKVLIIPGGMLLDIFEKNNHVGYLVMKRLASVISKRLRALRERFIKLGGESPDLSQRAST